MAASQVFGRGIGSKKFKLIIDAYPNIMDIFKLEGKDHVIKLINAISGFDVKTTNKIVDSMDGFIEFYKKLIKIKPNVFSAEVPAAKQIVNTSVYSSNVNKYIGETLVFTGFRDKNLQNGLEAMGIKISDSVSKNTKLVVASDPTEGSGKLTKAKELNIPIISKDEFIKSISK
jgi:NAD-dependent DNA ligase